MWPFKPKKPIKTEILPKTEQTDKKDGVKITKLLYQSHVVPSFEFMGESPDKKTRAKLFWKENKQKLLDEFYEKEIKPLLKELCANALVVDFKFKPTDFYDIVNCRGFDINIYKSGGLSCGVVGLSGLYLCLEVEIEIWCKPEAFKCEECEKREENESN